VTHVALHMNDRASSRLSETARLEAFSDGVFAIAITLLILEIRLPADVAPGALGRALLHEWPSYLAFLASFVTIGVMWVNHHRLFTLIRRSDDRLMALNLLLLLGVTWVPFRPPSSPSTSWEQTDARRASLQRLAPRDRDRLQRPVALCDRRRSAGRRRTPRGDPIDHAPVRWGSPAVRRGGRDRLVQRDGLPGLLRRAGGLLRRPAATVVARLNLQG
jgi:hypothetical protein